MTVIGSDIEQISRLEAALERAPRLAQRLFTPAERAYCQGKPRAAQHYAARFAAKEAFAKALGVPLSWQEVEVCREDSGRPVIRVRGGGSAAAALAGRPVTISLSHAGDYALAVVLIEGERL